MEELYDFSRHTHHVCILIEKTRVDITIYETLHKYPYYFVNITKEPKIIYNKQKTEILSWGTRQSELNSDCIVFDDFMNGLYCLFEKGKHSWNEDDVFFLEAVTQFFKLAIGECIYQQQGYKHIESLDSFHYGFIVPSEWGMEIQEDLIRPIFLEAGLISTTDHKDRLLFVSDLECIFCYMQCKNNDSVLFKKEQNVIVCRRESVDFNSVIIRLDLVQTKNALFDIPNQSLFPKISRSDYLFITSATIKNGIKKYLKYNSFFVKDDAGKRKIMKMIVDKIYEETWKWYQNGEDSLPSSPDNECGSKSLGQQDLESINNDFDSMSLDEEYDRTREIKSKRSLEDGDSIITTGRLKRLREDFDSMSLEGDHTTDKLSEDYDILSLDKDYDPMTADEDDHSATSDDNEYWKTIARPFSDKGVWKLDDSQVVFLNSIKFIDVISMIDHDIFIKINRMISMNSLKIYTLLRLGNTNSSVKYVDGCLITWVDTILSLSTSNVNNMGSVQEKEFKIEDIGESSTIEGASEFIQQTVRNSNMYGKPHIIPNENQIKSSAIFKDLGPRFIINIDISFKFTLISLFGLNSDGNVRKIIDYNNFTTSRRLPSFENFFDITSKTTLRTKEEFIMFADNYFLKNAQCTHDQFLLQAEAILNDEPPKKYSRAYIQQKKYIKAFLTLYFKYLYSKVFCNLELERIADLRIGYAITVDKMLLDYVIDSKTDLADLLYEVGLIDRNDDSKKLRIITKGEEVLSLIQPLLKLKFPVRSHFVLAQLHENYVQLTLNLVATSFDMENKQQEAIIMEDQIFNIQNIYDTLCQNMWNNLVQNGSLIQLCDIHYDKEILELFSLATKIEFMANFKMFILENILASNSDLGNFDGNSIRMNSFCNCKVNFALTDVVEISFKPLLKDITSICMGALINKDIFGNYRNIDYHFSLIHFNQNRRFLNIIIDILREECEEFNPWQGIDTTCIVIPELTTQFFQPTLGRQPYLHKGFLIGTLQQIYTENYAIYRRSSVKKGTSIETGNTIGEDISEIENDRYLWLFNKGDIINHIEVSEQFFLKPILKEDMYIHFDLYTYETDDVTCDESYIKEGSWNLVLPTLFDCNVLPVVITFKRIGYCSTNLISFRVVGEDTTAADLTLKTSCTMTLSRF